MFLIILLIVVLLFFIFQRVLKNPEMFKNLPMAGMSGYGFEKEVTDFPLFLNFYPKQMSADFNLRSLINHLKYQNGVSGVVGSSLPTIFNGFSRGVFTDGLGQPNIGRTLTPIILIPGLGVSPLYAKWDLTSSPNVKTLDSYGNFEMKDKWSCKQFQDDWVPLWPGPPKGLAKYCWKSNASVSIGDSGDLSNAEGVETIVPHFGTIDQDFYMKDLVEALQAKGYVNNSTLFSAPYDFRTIDENSLAIYMKSFCDLVENITNKKFNDRSSIGGNGVIIIGHDLGSVLITAGLNMKTSVAWRQKYIKKFISVAGSFGGCPKALRVLLSGEDFGKDFDRDVFRDTTKNFSGLHLLLPSPNVYGDIPLVSFQQNKYTSKDIPTLMNKSFLDGGKTASVYASAKKIQDASLKDPMIPVYVLGGEDVQTEAHYNYSDSLTDNPEKSYPYYGTNLPNSVTFNFNNYVDGDSAASVSNGDGTMPLFANGSLRDWKYVNFKFYSGAEHLKILSMYAPVKDILGIIE